jgi:hypothetical protein
MGEWLNNNDNNFFGTKILQIIGMELQEKENTKF